MHSHCLWGLVSKSSKNHGCGRNTQVASRRWQINTIKGANLPRCKKSAQLGPRSMSWTIGPTWDNCISGFCRLQKSLVLVRSTCRNPSQPWGWDSLLGNRLKGNSEQVEGNSNIYIFFNLRQKTAFTEVEQCVYREYAASSQRRHGHLKNFLYCSFPFVLVPIFAAG